MVARNTQVGFDNLSMRCYFHSEDTTGGGATGGGPTGGGPAQGPEWRDLLETFGLTKLFFSSSSRPDRRLSHLKFCLLRGEGGATMLVSLVLFSKVTCYPDLPLWRCHMTYPEQAVAR